MTEVAVASMKNPVKVLSAPPRSWWYFQEGSYWEEESLSAAEVRALLLERSRRKSKSLAKAILAEETAREETWLKDERERAVEIAKNSLASKGPLQIISASVNPGFYSFVIEVPAFEDGQNYEMDGLPAWDNATPIERNKILLRVLLSVAFEIAATVLKDGQVGRANFLAIRKGADGGFLIPILVASVDVSGLNGLADNSHVVKPGVELPKWLRTLRLDLDESTHELRPLDLTEDSALAATIIGVAKELQLKVDESPWD